MKQVGSRSEPRIALTASGSLLSEGARFNEAVSRLSLSTFVPKGIYRFRSHEAANQHADDCLIRGMAFMAHRNRPSVDRTPVPIFLIAVSLERIAERVFQRPQPCLEMPPLIETLPIDGLADLL